LRRLSETVDDVRLDGPTAEALRSDLVTRREALDVARSLSGRDRGRGRHELELTPTLIDMPLPETQAARVMGSLLAADAAVRTLDGDADGALDSCRAGLAAARSIGDEPTPISQIARAAIGIRALRSARRALGQAEPSDRALARLQALALGEMAEPLLLAGLRGERAILTEVVRRLGAGELPIAALSQGGRPFDPDAPRPVIAPWGRLLFENQQAVMLRWMNELVALGRQPPAARPPLWNAWQAEVDRVRHSRLGPYTATMPVLMTAALPAADASLTRDQADLGATALLLAAERHRLKTGDWPASISAIDPTLLSASPVDPFTGNPFRMERRDGRVVVYSVGPDLKDDHRASDPKRRGKGGPDDVAAVGRDVGRRGQPPPP